MAEQTLLSFTDIMVESGFAVQYQITPDLVREYCTGVDDTNLWYYAPSPFGPLVAPPTPFPLGGNICA